MKKLLLFTISLFFSVFCFAQTQILSHTVDSVDITTSNVSNLVLEVPTFDTTLGNLLEVKITAKITNVGNNNSMAVENINTTACVITFNKMTVGSMLYGSDTILPHKTFSQNNFTTSLDGFDGMIDFMGLSGYQEMDSLFADSTIHTLTTMPDIAVFKGDGIGEVPAATFNFATTSNFSGCGNAIQSIRTLHDVQVNVMYSYAAALSLAFNSFDVSLSPTGANLNWSMDDYNQEKFTIEKSNNGQDFSPTNISIEQLASAGGKQFFTAQEHNLNEGTTYFRLFIEENEGGNYYSNIVSIYKEDSKDELQIYPNPAMNVVMILDGSNVDKEFDVRILDLTGSQVAQLTTRGDHSIDVSNLTSGVYVMILDNKHERLFYKN